MTLSAFLNHGFGKLAASILRVIGGWYAWWWLRQRFQVSLPPVIHCSCPLPVVAEQLRRQGLRRYATTGGFAYKSQF